MKIGAEYISKIVRRALEEDIGSGDITTDRTVAVESESSGGIVVKEEGIIAGLDVVCEVYRQVDARILVECLIEDGHQIHPPDEVALVSGPTRGILTAERTALNFLQRVSGIATLTQQYVRAIAGTGAIILDTRKTTPGLRLLEKYAVQAGGGQNHRIGLYDMVLIKDNHLHIVGELRRAIDLGKRGRGDMPVEVEVKDLEGVRDAVDAGVDRIMLDNMGLKAMREAVSYIKSGASKKGKIEVEASGGIDLTNVRQVAQTGVDFISIGALTHSSRALDMAFYLK